MDRVEELACFVAVADEGSFVAAAKRLGRSPAGVTRAVAALESRLGARLLTRTTRAVALTQAGQRYLSSCRKLVSDFAALQQEVRHHEEEPSGSLTVTAPIVFGRLHVRPILTDFLRQFPSINVRLVLSDDVLPLVDERIDIGLRIAHLPDSSLKAIRVGRVARAVYASPAYLAARGEPRRPEDLAHHSCIAFTKMNPDPERWRFRKGKMNVSIAVPSRLVVNLAEPAIEAATAGMGLTCVLSYMADHLVAAGLLQRVLRAFEPPPLPVHLVYPAGHHLPRRTRMLMDQMTEVLRARFNGGN